MAEATCVVCGELFRKKRSGRGFSRMESEWSAGPASRGMHGVKAASSNSPGRMRKSGQEAGPPPGPLSGSKTQGHTAQRRVTDSQGTSASARHPDGGSHDKAPPNRKQTPHQGSARHTTGGRDKAASDKPHAESPDKVTTRGHSKGMRSSDFCSSRPCPEHSFLTDVADVRQMEQALLQLLDDFHSGKLQAFGQDCTFDKMDQIREQQERLARLHFDLDSQQEMQGLDSAEERELTRKNMDLLMGNLQELCLSIQSLQKDNPNVANESSEGS